MVVLTVHQLVVQMVEPMEIELAVMLVKWKDAQ
jgi:hypothetical protein